MRIAAAAVAALAISVSPAHAVLGTPGFRAVAVAHSAFPMSALAVAPDGRLFAAVQARGQTSGTTPGTAEIRVYSSYAANDGATLDEGILWATVDAVRATTAEEGLLGLALAPDFAASKLVYVYLTTTDEGVNQHIRVYRENAGGTGEYLGTVATSLEPPAEQATRSGGPLAFGADGCLYSGVGDNGGASRWNAQLLRGDEPIGGNENATTGFCADVCLGPENYPDRMVTTSNAPNHAGKILRMAVEGASPAGPAVDAPHASQPFVFGTGIRNPGAFGVHPLTGQLWMSERGDGQQSELDVVDRGTNLGWPCIEGGISSNLACMAGHLPAEVYTNHPDWRRPLVTHTANPAVGGIVAYTGLGYPAAYYGDVFYLLRDSARIYRVDLAPPCFLPHPNGVTPIAFHDSASDGDFTAVYDVDGDGDFETVSLPNLVSILQAPNPLGQQVLYLAGKQGNGNALVDDTIVFRIEYATAFTPYDGPGGRVADSCFVDGVYSGGGPGGTVASGWENPFELKRCLPPGGPCPGQPDGTPCDDGDPCNGAEMCQAGICRPGTDAADGTSCGATDACHAAGSCQRGTCVTGSALPDGTPCPDADVCNGLETCTAGVCQTATGPLPLNVDSLMMKSGGRQIALRGSIDPGLHFAPDTFEILALELVDNTGVVHSSVLDHPASDRFWKRKTRGMTYADRRGSVGGVTGVQLRRMSMSNVRVSIDARGAGRMPDATTMSARLRMGDKCFAANLGGRCFGDARKLRCGP